MSKKCYECYWESDNEEICDRCGKPIREVIIPEKEREKNQEKK